MTLKVLPITKSPAKAFVDFLINQGAIKPGFRSIIGSRDFPEIDDYLLKNKLVTQEELAKLYAEFYKLPFIRLVNMPLKSSVLNLFPKEIARKYMVVPYELTGNTLKLAIGEPSRLQQNAPAILVEMRRQKGLEVNLAVVPQADVVAVLQKAFLATQPPIAQISNTNLTAPKSPPIATKPALTTPPSVSVPPPTQVVSLNKQDLLKEVAPQEKTIDLAKVRIPLATLSKIPVQVAKRYKLIAFDQLPPKSKFESPLIKIALVDPTNPQAKEIISYIESKNKILVDRYKTSEESFEAALKQYPDVPEQKVEPKVEPKSELKVEAKIEEEKVEKAGETQKAEVEKIVSQIQHKPEIKPETDQKTVRTAEIPVLAQPNKPEEPNSDKTTRVAGVNEGVVLSSDDIVNRPSVGETTEELQRLAKEQESSLESQNLDKLLKAPVLSVEELSKVFKGGVIPEIVAATLFLAIRMKASDVHIEALANAVRLRYRIDGILHDIISVPHFLHAPLISRIKILAKMKIDEQRIPQDGRFDVIIDGHQVDLRISTLPTVHGEKVVMRLLDKSGGIMTLEQLGVTGTNFDRLISNINKPYGIILATGPTGSGKSTTLYAVLTRLSKPGVNIITLEDPVEYELPGINQAQVKPQIGFTFAEGLRSVLRQDPNIIMVGEVRDLETAAMATHAALTGHLVLSTLHTNDSSGALPRLINMGIEPFLITSSINAVVGQRLVRKVCDKCRERVEIPATLLQHIKKELAAMPSGQMKNINLEQLIFYHGKGCPECNNGYSGRIGIYEVLPMSDKIEELAVRKAPASELKKTAIAEGMITMLQDGLLKALKGITTVDEVMRVTTTHTKEVPGVE